MSDFENGVGTYFLAKMRLFQAYITSLGGLLSYFCVILIVYDKISRLEKFSWQYSQ